MESPAPKQKSVVKGSSGSFPAAAVRLRATHGGKAYRTNFGFRDISEKGTVRIGSVVIDVNDFAPMMAFWQAALRYVPVRPPTPGDPFVILKDPTGKGPNISIDEMPPERGRLHLDLYTDDQEREVERLLRLGATRYRPREPGEDFVVLADPEGSLFCVVDTTTP